jgi:DNA-binding CsgD family transcriptional regulator
LVSEVIARLHGTEDLVRAVDLLQEATLRMGAEVSLFMNYMDSDSRTLHRVLLACDPRWAIEYEQQGWFGDDPWLKYARHHTEPIRGSEIVLSSPADPAFFELGERFGFRSSVIVPAPPSPRLVRVGVLCLGSSRPGYFEADGFVPLKVVARSVAMELNEWWSTRMGRELVTKSRLTPEDLVLLSHELNGGSTKTIARQLGITATSIDSRFQRINAKLGVENRRAAARLVAEYGLI